MPATFFYISVWYTKAEMTKRIAIILSCSVIASVSYYTTLYYLLHT